MVIATHQARLGARRVQGITIDLDSTDNPTHGQQEFSFFNGHYGTWCDLPLMGRLTFNAEWTKHLVTPILRPGSAHANFGAIGTLRECLLKLGPRVIVSARRIVLHLPSAFPWLAVWRAATWQQLAPFSSRVCVYAAPRREMPRCVSPLSGFSKKSASPRPSLPNQDELPATACNPEMQYSA